MHATEHSETAPDPVTDAVEVPAKKSRRAAVRDWVCAHPAPLLWLAAAVAVKGAVGASVPAVGLDQGWMTALAVGAAEHRRHGHDLLFTYGPWGFVEHPLAVNRFQLLLGMVYAVAAAIAVFVAVYVCLRRVWSARTAAPVAFVLTLAAPKTEPGLQILGALIVLALAVIAVRVTVDRSLCSWRAAWPSALFGTVAAVLSQVKFSEGLAALVLAGVVSVTARTLRQLLWNLATLLLTLPVTFCVVWLAASQRLGDVWPWLTGSMRLSSGYQEAMTRERPDNVFGYVLAAVVVAVGVAVAVRAGRRLGVVVGAGIVLVVLTMLEFAFKHGFTRHDGHEVSFFQVAGFALVGLMLVAHRPRLVLIVAGLAFAMLPPNLDHFDPFVARDRWRNSVQALVDDEYRMDVLRAAQRQVDKDLQVPDAMVKAVGGDPVHVDPLETTTPWAYSMNWRPVPVFQSYSAYTADLDELNARAIAAAPGDQVVLRQARDAIDGRNPRWETPAYLLELVCGYTVVSNEGRWSMLRHGVDRCGEPRSVAARTVRAHETVDVPVAGPDEVLVARFVPEPDGPLAKLNNLVLKDWSPLSIRADGTGYRVPEGLASGPMLMAFPSSLGWAQPFGGFTYQRLAFSEPGRVEFQVIPLLMVPQ